MATTQFGTALNCMDGRTQDAVKQFLQERYGVDYVDQITEPGIVTVIAGVIDQPAPSLGWLRRKVSLSINHHHSQQIAVVAHTECAGNPVDRTIQLAQLRTAVQTVQAWQPTVTVVGLWVEPKAAQWSAQLIE